MKEEHFYLFEELGFYKTINENNVGIMHKYIEEHNINLIVMEDRKKIYFFASWGKEEENGKIIGAYIIYKSWSYFYMSRNKKKLLKSTIDDIINKLINKENK